MRQVGIGSASHRLDPPLTLAKRTPNSPRVIVRPVAADGDVSRRQIWGALVSPYLDTDGMVFLDFAVDVLGRSGLSLRELRRIDRQEVAPALWSQGLYGDWIVTDATLDRVHS